MNVKELVKYLGAYSTQQIYTMVQFDKIPFTNTGTKIVFDKKEIDKWNFKRLARIEQDKEFYNMQEAIEKTGLSKRTLYQYVNDDKIPFIKKGKFLMFPKAELETYILQR